MVIPVEVDNLLRAWADPVMFTHEQLRALYAVLQSHLGSKRNMTFLEYGTFRAASTSVLALVARERSSRVVTVDTFDSRLTGFSVDTYNDARGNLEARGLLSLVQLVRCQTQFFDFSQFAPGKVDLFFHDASHLVNDILFDVGNLSRHFSDDCLILVHDVCKGGAPTRPALEYLCRLYGVKGNVYLDGNVGALQLNGNPFGGQLPNQGSGL